MVNQFTRRDALSRGLKLAGAALLPRTVVQAFGRDAGYAPKLSVEAYVWTQYFDSHKLTVAQGVAQALKDTRNAGYRRVELSDPFFTPEVRGRTAALLRQNHLLPESVYASTTLHEPAAAESSVKAVLELAAFLKPLGTRTIVTDPSPKPQRAPKSDQELATQARYINQLGAGLKAQGIELLLHHHTPELAENAREWWYELDHTSAGCCVDVHWAYRGGQQVMPFLRRVGARLGDLHLRNSQQGVWMEDFGPGDIDYAEIAAYLHQIRYNGFLVVELAYEKGTAVTRSLEEDLRRSRVYTERTFGLT